jgi:hypothetical protein
MFIQQQILRPQERADEIDVLGAILGHVQEGNAQAAVKLCMARLVALKALSKPTLATFNPREEMERC